MGDFSDDYGGYDILGIYEDRENERIAQRAKLLTLPKQTGMLDIDRLEQWLDASLKERKQREWVGLTPTQVKLLGEGVQEEAIRSGHSRDWVFYTHINEALKDRNK